VTEEQKGTGFPLVGLTSRGFHT